MGKTTEERNLGVLLTKRKITFNGRYEYNKKRQKFSVISFAMLPNARMTGKGSEGSGRGRIKVIFRHLPGETEENYDTPQNSRCPGRNSN
jgi:hypothetical protein